MKSQRIGIFGGSFNPPHLGHRRLAELALQHLNLHELRIIPTYTSPHKESYLASAAQRLRMVELNFHDLDPRISISKIEIDRSEPSYTFQTLKHFAEEEPYHSWVLVLGSDALDGFEHWQHWESILTICQLAVAPRPDGTPQVKVSIPYQLLPSTELPWSSRTIRDELREGRRPQGLKPEVLSFLLDQGLYTA
jgi:nicotinate-nucleotide adenylyltransferase